MSSDDGDLKSFQLHFLRALGILCIILAHIKLPQVIFQLRNYNAVLLVLISGATFSLRYAQKPIDVSAYLRNRIIRLLLPSYIFLSFYFVAIFLGTDFLHLHLPKLSQLHIIYSYLFDRIWGISYLWIIAIYLIVAIFTPVVDYFNKREENNFRYFFVVGLLLIFHEGMIMFLRNGFVSLKVLEHSYLFYIIPYVSVFAVGVRLYKCNLRHIVNSAVLLFILFLIVAVILAINQGHFVWTQDYKYSPRLYYLLYALPISLGLYSLVMIRMPMGGVLLRKIVFFISKNSLWIYLWHIVGIDIVSSSYWQLPLIKSNALLEWFVVVAWALSITFSQIKVIGMLYSIQTISPNIKGFLKTAFL